MNKNWRWERNQERWGTRVGRMVWDFLSGSRTMNMNERTREIVKDMLVCVGWIVGSVILLFVLAVVL